MGMASFGKNMNFWGSTAKKIGARNLDHHHGNGRGERENF
jgi:hypothetical protein